MPNTSNIALPYPALTDAPNVPQHLQNLAGAVDTRLGGAWNSFQFTTDGSVGFTMSGATQSNAYKMLGNKTMLIRVHLNFTAAAFSGTAPIELGPFPNGISVSGVNMLSGMIYRSTSAVHPVACVPSANRIVRIHYVNGTVTGSAPWTWAAGDIVRLEGTVEVA